MLSPPTGELTSIVRPMPSDEEVDGRNIHDIRDESDGGERCCGDRDLWRKLANDNR